MTWLDDLTQDGRLAVRVLARSPGFAAAAVATLALGIGLPVAMFTVYDAVLRRPLPVRDQDRLVVLWGEAEGSIRRLPLTHPHFERFREDPQTLQEVAGVLNPRGWPHAVRDGERGLALNLAAVTGNFFRVLGSEPVLGRLLRPEDDVDGAERVMVISHRLWRRHFGGDQGVIGRTLTLHEKEVTHTIVGVAPPGLEYPAGADFWVPLTLFTRLEAVPLGRLAPGATPAQAAAELRASFQRDGPVAWRDVRAVATPLPDVVIGDIRPALRLLSAAAALLFFIGCFNVANLLLARGSGRMHEIAVRRALGAGQGRIVRQLLTESGILGLAGGLLGVALAGALVNGLLSLAPLELPRLEEIRLARVPLGWAAVISAAATVSFGLLPALIASGSLTSPIRATDRSATESMPGRRLQDALVVLQIGLALVVLAAAGLLGRSLVHLQRLDMGFTSERLAFVELTWPDAKFDTPVKVGALYDRLISRIAALPGVVSVAPMHLMPFEGASGGIDGPFVAEGTATLEMATSPVLSIEVVGPGYFHTMGIPLVRGRAFTDADRAGSPRVIVITEAVARLFWPGQEALGRRLGMGQPQRSEDWWTVIGIIPETRYREVRQPTPTVYVATSQFMSVRRLAIRTIAEPGAIIPSVRDAVQDADPDTFVVSAQTMEELLARELAQPRLSTVLLGVFGVGALVLSGVGLYGMLAYAVRRRTRELAIRHALGASPSHLRTLVMGRALALAGAGVLAGLGAALAGGRLLGSLLFGISPTDVPTLAGVASVVLTVALAASYLPARRAMHADPAAVLRQE